VIKSFQPWLERAMMHERLFTLGVAIVIGVLCGFGAVGFKHLIHLFQQIFWGQSEVSLDTLKQSPWWRSLLMPALGGLAVGPIIHYFAREAKGHGVPEVMLAVAVRQGIIRVRVAFAKALASAFTIASGGSAGREGPIIQIGAAIGSWVGQLLKVSGRKLRTFVGCGAAAGIAATFNAPMAGALFAVEVILGEFGVAQFSPIVISSVLATVIARHHFGGGPVFEAPEYELGKVVEMGPYFLLGVLCGAISFAFIKTLYFAEDAFDRLKRVHPAFRPMLGGLALGLLGWGLPHVFGDGYETVNLALSNQLPLMLLVALLAAKILATSLTLGSGGSGGVFAPSLFMGAMLGGALGAAAVKVLGDAPHLAGGYALVAMGGLVAGATHAPISAILIIFEITYDYAIILPLMMVCIVSTVVSQALSRESVYTLKLVRKGIDLVGGRSVDLLRSHRVGQCLSEDYEAFRVEAKLSLLVDQMLRGERTQFYIVSDSNRLQGVVSVGDLRRILLHREALEQVLLVEDMVNTQVPVCTRDDTLSAALLKFEHSGFTELPVVENLAGRRLVGVLRYTEVLAIYNEEIMRQDSADGLAQRVMSSEAGRKVRLVRGFSVIEWDPPSSLWNLTLAQADLPARYSVRVILVKKKAIPGYSGEELVPTVPGRDYLIAPEDTFLIYGRDEDLDNVRKL